MKILSKPKGNAEEYGRWSVNAYLGCPNQCQYCYLQTGPGAKTLGGHKARLKAGVISEEHAYHMAMTEILEHRDEIIRDGGLFFTFTSDPCLPETRKLTLTIAHDAASQMRIPVMILTKDATFLSLDPYEEQILGLDMIEKWRRSIPFYQAGNGRLNFIENPHFTSDPDPIAFGFTLTGHDELEPNASPNADRIKAMQQLTEMHFKTWASIEPVIDFSTSANMIRQALSAGCQHFKIGLLTSRTRVDMQHYRRQYGDRLQNYLDLFIDEIQELNQGHGATIYWKQSIRSLAGRDLTTLPNTVDARWSMFNK